MNNANTETLRLMIAAVAEERERLQGEYNAAIDYAIETDDPAAFLRTWREGDTETLASEWPDFKAYNASLSRGTAEGGTVGLKR
ncbi:MAG TPA: hypothetical protein VFS13_00675 [Steroidobacteraceae bacterium]|nr:hypothetical protein [Steroidobacteraceae bacterium]